MRGELAAPRRYKCKSFYCTNRLSKGTGFERNGLQEERASRRTSFEANGVFKMLALHRKKYNPKGRGSRSPHSLGLCAADWDLGRMVGGPPSYVGATGACGAGGKQRIESSVRSCWQRANGVFNSTRFFNERRLDR